MASSTLVSVKDSNAVFTCPPDSLLGVWALSTEGANTIPNVPAGVYRMDTKGNNCYMEYSFTATGVSVNILGNYDHGVYSCQLDDGEPQWFNSNGPSPSYSAGCAISGLSNDKHTLRVTSAPMSGWWLTVQNITLTTGDAFTGTKTFTSGWPAYQLPANLVAQAAASTVTAVTTSTVTATATSSSSSGNHVSTGAFAAVAAILAILFVGATIAAVYFWVRDSRFRRDHQWTQAISAAPIAYTTEPTTSSNNMEHNPLTPPLQPSMQNHYPSFYPVTRTDLSSSSIGVSNPSYPAR